MSRHDHQKVEGFFELAAELVLWSQPLQSRPPVGLILLAILTFHPAAISGQLLPETERTASYRRYLNIRSYLEGIPPNLVWTSDGQKYWFADGSGDTAPVFLVDPESNLKEATSQSSPFRDNRPGGHDGENSDGDLRSPAGEWYAKIRDNDLWLAKEGERSGVRITTDGEPDHRWVIEPNSRRLGSFWTGSGGRWSPSAKKLALKKIDARKVQTLSVVRFKGMPVSAEPIKFVIPGAPMFQTELFVLDVATKKLVRLDTSRDEDLRLDIVGWRADESEVLFLALNRLHDELRLMAGDVRTGRVRTILTETNDTFVVEAGEEFHDTIFFQLEEGERFIWISERDGWRHLYLYERDGALVRQLSKGGFAVRNVEGVDEKNGWVYFKASGESRPYDTHLYRVRMDGGGLQRLTPDRGRHSVTLSPSFKFFIDDHSYLERPRSIDLRRSDGTLVRKIWKVNANRLKEINWRPPEEFTVKAADGKTDLYGIMFKPSDFDPERKYPVVDFFDDEGLWGLMHFTSWPYLQALSEMGFIVFMLNERGMAGRNKAFLDSRYRNIGRFEIPDHVTALEQLARQRPYLDTERVGVCGGSRGGYMVLRAMLTAPDVYKVGVADSPDVDLLHDDHFYFEPAMGLPSDNPEGYEYASNVRLAKNLKGKLQIMVGTGDYGIYPGTMAMIAALVEERKPHDLVFLPNQPHQFTGAAGEFARDSNTRYLIQHLRP